MLFGSTFLLITGLFGIWSVHLFHERPAAGFGVTFFLISAGQLLSPAIAGAAADKIAMAWIFNLTAIVTLVVIGFLPSIEIRQMSHANRVIQ